MKRRDLLKTAIALPLSAAILTASTAGAESLVRAPSRALRSRLRPSDPGWPAAAEWARLENAVGGRLLQPTSPFANCSDATDNACAEALRHVRNPYYLGDDPALTQSSGWVDAWTSSPSVYAVAATGTADVVAAVNFARKHQLRLVVKGGGHSYQGTSNAPDSLLVWTRRMNDVTMHAAFVAEGCAGRQPPQPAMTVGAGALWIDAYRAVTAVAGRYVQGGGCATVRIAGHVQSGGFGSWSKRYGTAAAGLLEAQIVTADGEVRIVNLCRDPDLFWALKGGGGGSLGVVTRLTLRTRELPELFGGMFAMVSASSDEVNPRQATQKGRSPAISVSELPPSAFRRTPKDVDRWPLATNQSVTLRPVFASRPTLLGRETQTVSRPAYARGHQLREEFVAVK